MTEPLNTGPKDPATTLEQYAADLRSTAESRTKQIVDLAKQIAQLTNRNDRDLAAAAEFDKAAEQLKRGPVVFMATAATATTVYFDEDARATDSDAVRGAA